MARLRANLSAMSEWIYFIHPPRTGFIATITDEERAIFGRHAGYLADLHAAGTLILAGPTLGEVNTGVHVFEAADEDAARAVMDADPAIASGLCRGELRPIRVSYLRGRDEDGDRS
jgi:uncharacterized protein